MPRKWVWLIQGLLVVVLIGFLSKALASNWAEFKSLDVSLDLKPGWIVLAALVVWFNYAILVEAWRRILRGWGQQVAYPTAARIWFVSNLGRYLPGKIWSIAGLAVLAHRVGVAGWAAAGSVLAMQALAVGTGAGVAGAAAPRSVSPLQLGIAVLVAALAIGLLIWKPFTGRLPRLVGSTVELKPLPVGTALVSAGATTVTWVGYGLAFWLLAHGMLAEPALPLRAAVGVFAAGYIAGLLALFAPGGLGVREVVFVALLAPTMGSGSALALSVGSRLLLTLTEVAAVLTTLMLHSRVKGEVVDEL